MDVSNIPLNNGKCIPPLGLGTYLGNELAQVIIEAINVGYRLIDTAYIYHNEKQIGAGLQKIFAEGKVKREDLFVVSKLWNDRHHQADVLAAIQNTLKDLQLNYLDLYLIHWPFATKAAEDQSQVFGCPEDDVPIEETWLAMEECVNQGYVKSIGVSNFNRQQLEKVLNVATIKPVINQVECNPYLSQEKLRTWCKEHDIVLMAYSPFYAPGRPNSESHGLNIFTEPIIQELGKKYNKNENQIILRYLIQCGVVPVPKTDKPERLRSNFNVFDFVLSDDDFQKMRTLNKGLRCTLFISAMEFKEYPFNADF